MSESSHSYVANVRDEIEEAVDTQTTALEDANFNLHTLTTVVQKIGEIASGDTLHAYERPFSTRIIQSILLNDGDEITANFPRQTGKTHTVGITCMGLTIALPKLARIFPEQLGEFTKGIHIGIFAPNGEQAKTLFMRLYGFYERDSASEVLQDKDINDDWDYRGGYILLRSGSFIFSQSAAPRSKIESKTYHMVIIDEAQDMEERVVLKSIHPMVASKNGSIIKIGSASDKKCEFKEVIDRNTERDTDLKRGGLRNHYIVSRFDVAKENPKYGKFIAKEIERYGEESEYFRMNYGNEWILGQGMFITQTMLDRCINKDNYTRQEEKNPCCVGIDFGKKQDSLVITILKPLWNILTPEGFFTKILLNWAEERSMDYNDQFRFIVDFLTPYNVMNITVDSTGVGEPCYDRLREHYIGRVNVNAFVFSLQSKSDGYKQLKQELESARIIIPGRSDLRKNKRFQRFYNQTLSLEKDYKNGYMMVHHPKGRDAHDDYPDSLMLANLACGRFDLPEIKEQDSTLFMGRPSDPNEIFESEGVI